MWKFISKILDKSKSPIIYIVLAAGILLLCLSGISPSSEKNETETYEFLKIDEQLESALSDMEGVGKVKVVVNYVSGNYVNYAKDITTEKSGDRESKEEKIVTVGSGTNEKPAVLSHTAPRIGGVIVVAEGGGSSIVKSQITSAVKSLTGISANCIGVFKMED